MHENTSFQPPVMQPWHLESAARIRRVFRCGQDSIERMVRQGAPIVVRGEGNNRRYCAEYNRLLAWMLANSHPLDA